MRTPMQKRLPPPNPSLPAAVDHGSVPLSIQVIGGKGKWRQRMEITESGDVIEFLVRD
jgi:hypothetical protein